MASLKRALTLAAPEGYVRTFISNGPGLPFLLQQARASRDHAGLHRYAIGSLSQEIKDHPVEVDKISGLVEPLSEREMDVLKLLAQGCNDKKIAETLVIARETVHKHLKNIYGKLDVHSRTEAVARARELSLL